jgi:ribosomal protein S18 acetylase RimI-like enzyme
MSHTQSSPDAPTVRPLEPEDLDAVVALAIPAWQPVFESFAEMLGGTIFDHLYQPRWQEAQADSVRRTCLDERVDAHVVIAPDGCVAGYVALADEVDAGIGHVEQIAVHPAYQRRGYARVLMRFAIERFRANGMVMVNVGTGGDPGHAPARALYESVGFVGVPLVNYYSPIE